MIIATPEEMVAYGRELGKQYNYLLLEWELGAGKTHLVKWFADAKGLKEDEIQSPTYTYIHEHEGKLLHIDMYRIEDPDFLLHKWILEKIHNYPAVIIEWPRFIEQYVDPTRKKVTIQKISPTEREVILTDVMPSAWN